VALAACVLALVASCGRSPPTQFFTLAPVRADQPARRFAGSPVQVRAVHIPAELDRPQRVVQSSPDRLEILELQRWGGPLNDMVRQILTEDLMTRLPPGMVLAADMPAGPDARGIVVDISEFQPEPAGRVVLEASWSVLTGQAGQPGARAGRRFEINSAVSADAQVAAMSQLIGQLADAIAATLQNTAA
jgi:uncharacterized protein